MKGLALFAKNIYNTMVYITRGISPPFTMPKTKVTHCYSCILLCAFLFLGGCEARRIPMEGSARDSLIIEDLATLHANADHLVTDLPDSGDIFLTLPNAVKRGVLYNLDARVAAMEYLAEQDDIALEQLRALPTMNASVSAIGRDNLGASSSRSILTGQQSLEPSQSTEEHRRTVELEATWNIIDAALALSDSQTAEDEAMIASSRYRKIIQTVQKDVYAAYWRAMIAQNHGRRIQTLLDKTESQLAKLQTAQQQNLMAGEALTQRIQSLVEKQQQLLNLKQMAEQSVTELKSLVSVPLDRTLVLDDKTLPPLTEKTILQRDIIDLEIQALSNRPEMDEEIAEKNIAHRNAREEMLKTFPGLELFFSNQYDSNKFLNDPNWSTYSATILQSLTNIISAPARMRQADNEIALTDARRQALILAIMAQTRLALYRLAIEQESMDASETLAQAMAAMAYETRQKHDSGFVSGQALLQAEIDSLIATLQHAANEADYQEALAAMMVTLGRDLPFIKTGEGAV